MTESRLYSLNDAPPRPEREYVLYWMTSARRLHCNFALEHAVERATTLGRPLLILEALRCGYPYANDRLHTFVLQGMEEHQAALRRDGPTYYPYVEPSAGAGSGLLATLASRACVVVTDWYPAFFLPRMHAAAGARLDVRLEAIDTNGLLPVAEAGRAVPMAHGFRSHLQRTLRPHLAAWPVDSPLESLSKVARKPIVLPSSIVRRWPPATFPVDLARLPIDHDVSPVAMRGGRRAARERLDRFVTGALAEYGEHNQPERDATSRLSPWLHFGHLSAHEVFQAVMSRERWTSRKLGTGARGAKDGWWHVSPPAEAFLDELVTWRELAFNTSAFLPAYDGYASLPPWALKTLDAHRRDRRPYRYTLEQLDAASTHDPLWNAIQRQLQRDGWFHGYMRMLWGKKILEWTARPEDAIPVMANLMNRYSLDGRDPNSWAGFAWVLGRYDRPWPEREIFGQVRYMSSVNTARKLRVKDYLRIYGDPAAGGLFPEAAG